MPIIAINRDFVNDHQFLSGMILFFIYFTDFLSLALSQSLLLYIRHLLT